MLPLNSESTLDLSLLSAESLPAAPRAADEEVLLLFDRHAASLLRYVGSFGLLACDTEDVVQDVFLSLYRHVQRGRPRNNLRGWVFRVAHNLALKHQRKLRRFPGVWDEAFMAGCADASPNPEEQASGRQRLRRLLSVLRALPERDRRCLCLRAEGLRYREIGDVLGISLGAVAKALARALNRMERAAER